MKDELIVKNKPKSTISEDIRTIRTNIEFSSVDDDVKVVMVTSTQQGEGKSFVSSNLAVSFAQNNKKVLLIDCDLRLGRIHKIFELSNKKGLSNLIGASDDKIEYEDYIQKTDIKNLYVLTRGLVPSNPSELLSSARFAKIISELKEVFEYIIIDSVPTSGLSDALILSKYADRTAIVCGYGKTDVDDLNETKKALQNVGAKIAGVIINGSPRNRGKYGYYYFE